MGKGTYVGVEGFGFKGFGRLEPHTLSPKS